MGSLRAEKSTQRRTSRQHICIPLLGFLNAHRLSKAPHPPHRPRTGAPMRFRTVSITRVSTLELLLWQLVVGRGFLADRVCQVVRVSVVQQQQREHCGDVRQPVEDDRGRKLHGPPTPTFSTKSALRRRSPPDGVRRG